MKKEKIEDTNYKFGKNEFIELMIPLCIFILITICITCIVAVIEII